MKRQIVMLLALLCATPAAGLRCERPRDAMVLASTVRLERFPVARSAQETKNALKPDTTYRTANDPAFVGAGVSRAVVGRAVSSAPMRIVSTSPSITESLFALGLGPRVVGVSNFCQYPPEVSRVTRIGSFLKPDVELIARLHPDLVLVNAGPHQAERQLTALGIRAITVSPGTLAQVYSTIKTIGEAASASDRANALVAELRQRLARVQASVAGRPSKKVLVIVGRRTGALSDIVAVGGRSYLGELIGIAGGINVLSGDHLPEYPRISLETVIRLAPDVVVDAADMGETLESRRRKRPETLAMWRREEGVAAVRGNAVHVVTSDAFLVPGPRVVEAAETFAQWFHGAKGR